MKRLITLLLISALCISVLAGCNTKLSDDSSEKPPQEVSDRNDEMNDENVTEEPKYEKVTFETTDLDGNEVTSEVFADYDLTMINVWGTGCVPCIEEMPGLAKFSDQLPENVNMLSICVDYESDPEFAKDVLRESNANFKTLKVDGSMYESILVNAQALPTTIFVDSEGNIVGDIIKGAPDTTDPDEITAHYNKYVDERLGVGSEG